MATVLIQQTSKRQAFRWYPDGAQAMEDPNGNGVVYLREFQGANGIRFEAIAYAGKAGNSSWHYTYKTREAAETAARSFFENLASHKQRVANWRKEQNKPHTLKPGDIITNSWGYDQTNVDWYRVTRTTKHFVWLKPIAAEVEETSFMAGPSLLMRLPAIAARSG